MQWLDDVIVLPVFFPRRQAWLGEARLASLHDRAGTRTGEYLLLGPGELSFSGGTEGIINYFREHSVDYY